MKNIQQIIIHKDLVNRFLKKSLEVLPSEYIAGIMGEEKNGLLLIYDLIAIEVERTVFHKEEDSIEIFYYKFSDDAEAENFKYFGSIHSHPACSPIPSELDIETFYKGFNDEADDIDGDEIYDGMPRDIIMGIMQVNKKEKVSQYNLMFYNIDLNPIETLISENL